MKLKTGRTEIVYLLTKVLEKHEWQTGEPVIRNTNRKNYEGVAKKLSEISHALPHTAAELRHDPYPPDDSPKNLAYPFRKYDITASQVKDAFLGIVNNPRPFLTDACYIFLYGTGRKGFAENPEDANLLEEETTPTPETDLAASESEALRNQVSNLKEEKKRALNNFKKQRAALFISLGVVLLTLFFFLYKWRTTKEQLAILKNDLFLIPHQPTKAEIDSLEGIWLSYTGSPQARRSDPNRYHIVISNVLDVRYKDGYFRFTRYGASFNHVGYMQFDAPGLVSIHSFAKTNTGRLESPKYSLMKLDGGKPYLPVISASWNFDAGQQNKIIGIREVFIKQGKGGRIEEVINSTENVSCRCKIIKWHRDLNDEKIFYLKNEMLDTLPDPMLKTLLDEKSILPRVPQEIILLSADTINR